MKNGLVFQFLESKVPPLWMSLQEGQLTTAEGNIVEHVLDGATTLNIIIGDPIAQVKSPTGMSRKLAAKGRNSIVVPAHVKPTDLAGFLDFAKTLLNLESILVTIPHKFACFSHCATVSGRAAQLGAVQSLRLEKDGTWYGDNFDGLSFVTAAQRNGAKLEGAKALLIGAGGAGSAIGLSLIEAGVSSLTVCDPDRTRLDALIARLLRVAKVPVMAGGNDPSGFDFVANASPMGMNEGDPLPVDVTRLSPSAFVGCVVTKPIISPLIAAARAIGCSTSTGVEMSDAAQEFGIKFAEREI